MKQSPTFQDLPTPILYEIAEFLDAHSLRSLYEVKELQDEMEPFFWKMVAKKEADDRSREHHKRLTEEISGEIYTMTRDGMLEMIDGDDYGLIQLKPIGRSAYYQDAHFAFLERIAQVQEYFYEKKRDEEYEAYMTRYEDQRWHESTDEEITSDSSDE